MNTRPVQNPVELGWVRMLDLNLARRKSTRNLRQKKALTRFESDVETRRDYYELGGRW
jgi:hypothetical protein